MADAFQIGGYLGPLLEPGQVVELRALGGRGRTMAGYFTDLSKLASAAVRLDRAAEHEGIYYTPNPCLAALLARAENRTLPAPRGGATKDVEILRRRWLLVDVDAVRPTGISSTDPEHEEALARAQAIRSALEDSGWPAPVEGDSGNGSHLMYRLDEPNDEPTRLLIERVLKALGARFSDDAAAIDPKVANAARVWKLPGTTARKGTSMPDRPWRQARVLRCPSPIVVVTRPQLEELAGPYPTVEKARQPGPSNDDLRVRRARAYLAKIPPAIAGQNGHGQAFAAACAVVRGFDLERDVAAALILADYNPRCDPPWSESEIEHKVADADEKSTRPRGYLLGEANQRPAPLHVVPPPHNDSEAPPPREDGAASPTRAPVEPVGFASAAERLTGEAEERADLVKRMVPFGMRFLDDALGGILPRDLIVLGAATGVGKTALATIISQQSAVARREVFYFALEGEPREIERRLKYRELVTMFYANGRGREGGGRLGYRDWYLGRLNDLLGDYDREAETRLRERYRTLHTLYRGTAFDLEALEVQFRAIESRAHLIVLDHLQYVDTDARDENRGYKAIVKRVRELSLGAGVPVILVAHLRKKDRSHPTLIPETDDFHGTSEVTKMANIAILLAPAKREEGESAPSYVWPTYMHIAKDRMEGATARFVARCWFDARETGYRDAYEIGQVQGLKYALLEPAQQPRWYVDGRKAPPPPDSRTGEREPGSDDE